MFSHIPVDVFCTQIRGNVNDALQVLDTRLRYLQSRPKRFDWEFLSLDPENPITQVSKTPSDEEFPCEWENEITPDEGETLENAPSKIPRTPFSSKILHLQQGSESVEGETQKEEESLKPEEAKRDEVIDIKNDETTKNIAKIIRPEKPTSIIKSHFIVNDVLKFIEEMKLKVSQEDDEVRIIPSHSACRFELPIDMSKLKDLTPFTYLVKFCRADESRRIIYETQFDKYRNNKGSDLLFLSDIRIIYENLFHEETLADELLNLRRLLDWDLREGLDKELFVVVSCLMERIIVRSKEWNLEKGFKRNDYESIEFYALNGKLHGIEINSSLHHLLEFIRNA